MTGKRFSVSVNDIRRCITYRKGIYVHMAMVGTAHIGSMSWREKEGQWAWWLFIGGRIQGIASTATEAHAALEREAAKALREADRVIMQIHKITKEGV